MIETVPEAILQRCIKIADEAPQDLKSNLRRAFSKFSQDDIDNCSKPREFKACLFGLCFFHSLICGRRRFGPQGFSRAYPFNDGDLTICSDVLGNYLNMYDNVPWPDLRYIFGEIMYGGHITDQWDRRTTNTYLSCLIIPEILTNMNLAPGFKSPDSSKLQYTQYQKYIEEKFPGESPQMFGMHPNAEIGFLTNQGIGIFNTFHRISGGQGGSGSMDLSVCQPTITSLLEQLPKDFDMLEIRKNIVEPVPSPYVIVSLQEAERMNRLLNTIRKSLLELELGISGALNVTESMESLADNLMTNSVNANWVKHAYPSLKPLAAWFSDLVSRCDQLEEWTTKLELLKSIWIAGMFNPMSFLTAVMQVTARKDQLPLDFMVNRWVFTNYREPRELPNVHEVEGVYVHGLFMEGASWEEGKGGEEGYITDSKLKDLHPKQPIANVFAIHQDHMSWESMYVCPIFVTSARGATYLCKMNCRMDADDSQSRWILAGACMLLSEE